MTAQQNSAASMNLAAKSDDELNVLMLAAKAELLSRQMSRMRGEDSSITITTVDYSGDTYPRAGCQIVIDLAAEMYSWRVYSPRSVLTKDSDAAHSEGRLLESYAPRPLASIGIAIEAFTRGAPVRSAFAEMRQAERDALNRRRSYPA